MDIEKIQVHREDFGGHLPDCDRCGRPLSEGDPAYLKTADRTAVIVCEDHADELEQP